MSDVRLRRLRHPKIISKQDINLPGIGQPYFREIKDNKSLPYSNLDSPGLILIGPPVWQAKHTASVPCQ